MLVKKSIVEAWYQRDSWVYRNFSYLFENPLWNKNVPGGFSVCPYFWLSIFSLLVFRPFFVAPIHYIIVPIIKLIGKPASAADNGLFNLLNKLGIVEGHRKGTGIGVAVSFVLLLALVGCSALLVVLVMWVKSFYPYLTEDSASGKFAFWSFTSFAALFGIIALHKKITNTECKTMSYLYVWLAGLLVSMFIFIPSETLAGFQIFFGLLWWVISGFAGIIWEMIKTVGNWIGIGLMWKPIDFLRIPWWAYLLILGAIGFLSDYVLRVFNAKVAAEYSSGKQDYAPKNRQEWVNILNRILTSNEYWKDGKVFTDDCSAIYDKIPISAGQKACLEYRDMIYRKALEIALGAKLDELQKQYPLISRSQLATIASMQGTDHKFYTLSEVINFQLGYSVERFTQAVLEAVNSPDIKPHLDRLTIQLKEEEAARNKKRNLKRQSKEVAWAHLTCLRVTTAINDVACRVGRGLVWIGHQSCTLVAYLWMLAKAKKKGACPYFRFTDPTKKS